MIIVTLSSTALLLVGTPDVPRKIVPVLKVDNAVLLDDIVVIGSRVTYSEPELAITERVSSPPASLTELTTGLVSGTLAAAEDKSAAQKQVDADLDRATRALQYNR